ncbi:MAG: MBL fold metallo-hydrolase [Chloroflexota bacterium]|nr:MBL fold metallo-hydrolase [Chloroflexota bacterium]
MVKIAIDPGKNLWLFKLDSLIPKSEWKGVTHVLVTHGDPDHFVYAISMAKKTGAKVVCGEELMEDFLSDTVEDVHKIDVGGVVDLEDFKVEGLKVKHGPLPIKLFYGLMEMKNVLLERSHGGQEVFFASIKLSEKQNVTKVRSHGTIKLLFGLIRLERDNVDFARGSIGFSITIGDKTVVNLGDTVLQKGWEGLKPDVLMIPIGGRVVKNTMDEKEALEAVRLMEPKKVIPCHYNGDFLWKRNINPADDQLFKREVEKMGIECTIMGYGAELIV